MFKVYDTIKSTWIIAESIEELNAKIDKIRMNYKKTLKIWTYVKEEMDALNRYCLVIDEITTTKLQKNI